MRTIDFVRFRGALTRKTLAGFTLGAIVPRQTRSASTDLPYARAAQIFPLTGAAAVLRAADGFECMCTFKDPTLAAAAWLMAYQWWTGSHWTFGGASVTAGPTFTGGSSVAVRRYPSAVGSSIGLTGAFRIVAFFPALTQLAYDAIADFEVSLLLSSVKIGNELDDTDANHAAFPGATDTRAPDSLKGFDILEDADVVPPWA